jgi:hypothetical protein
VSRPDKILLGSGQAIDYDGTAWSADASKYAQPDGFKSVESAQGAACHNQECTDAVCKSALGGGYTGCKGYTCAAATADYYGCTAGSSYVTWYPDDSSMQYLYETFPEVVSPMMGVDTDRFQVWMRVAALPQVDLIHM